MSLAKLATALTREERQKLEVLFGKAGSELARIAVDDDPYHMSVCGLCDSLRDIQELVGLEPKRYRVTLTALGENENVI